MNMPLPAYNKTLLDLEVLRARLEIRDFFLKDIYRQVYENIGQLLSLARVMLVQRDNAEPASELVGRSIRELREMCRSFYPDENLLQENGFSEAITKTIDIIFPGSSYLVKQISLSADLKASLKLIIFSMLLEVLLKIREIGGKPEGIAVTCTKYRIDCILYYSGEPILLDENPANQFSIEPVSLQQKAGLINGKFEILQGADGITRLKLFCPLN